MKNRTTLILQGKAVKKYIANQLIIFTQIKKLSRKNHKLQVELINLKADNYSLKEKIEELTNKLIETQDDLQYERGYGKTPTSIKKQL